MIGIEIKMPNDPREGVPFPSQLGVCGSIKSKLLNHYMH